MQGLENPMDWIWDNREWLFSGVAVVAIGSFVTWLFRSRKKGGTAYRQRQSGGKGSTNVQIGSIGRDDRKP